MKEVSQTIFTPPSGNCFAACVASLFDLPLWVVPNFVVLDRWEKNPAGGYRRTNPEPVPLWWTRLGSFACDHGYRVMQLVNGQSGIKWGGLFMHGDYGLVTVKSPRGDWDHVVVADIVTATVVWDPHPEGWEEGHQLEDKDIKDWILFVALR